jgi:hypothetical protein
LLLAGFRGGFGRSPKHDGAIEELDIEFIAGGKAEFLAQAGGQS